MNRRPVLTALAALIVVLLSGVAAYRDMPRSEDPGFIIRTAVVQTVFPGASPERVCTAFRTVLSDQNVSVILVNIFAGINRCDWIEDWVSGEVVAERKAPFFRRYWIRQFHIDALRVDAVASMIKQIEVPDEDEADFQAFLDSTGYAYVAEADNPAYAMFLAPL